MHACKGMHVQYSCDYMPQHARVYTHAVTAESNRINFLFRMLISKSYWFPISRLSYTLPNAVYTGTNANSYSPVILATNGALHLYPITAIYTTRRFVLFRIAYYYKRGVSSIFFILYIICVTHTYCT